MVLFGRKKKAKETKADTTASEALEQAVPTKAAKPKKRSRNELLSSVFQESVLSSAMSEMRENAPFEVEYDFGEGPEKAHVLLALDTDSIGGLSKKTANDEDRGSIIQSCNAGVMSTFMTDGMLEDNLMSFIPTAETLRNMDEYSILSNATYHPLIISDDIANVKINVLIDDDDRVDLSLADAQAVLDGRLPITNFIEATIVTSEGATGVAQLQDVLDEYSDEDAFATPMMDNDVSAPYESADVDVMPNAPVDDYDDDYGYDSDMDNTSAFAAIDTAMSEQALASEEISAGAQGSTFEREEPVYVQPEPVQEVPQVQNEAVAEASPEMFNDILARRFFKSDLAFDVSLDAFDTHFGTGAPVVEFEEDRGEGWLQEGLSERARIANIEMRRLHDTNLQQLRQRYVLMVEQLADSVEAKVSSDPAAVDSEFSADFVALDETYRDRLDSKEEEVERRKTRIVENYNDNLNRAAERAAAAARATYARQHEDEHKRELHDIDAEVESSIRDEYLMQKRQLEDMRFARGHAYFERGVTGIFERLTSEYVKMCAREDELYRAFRDDMNAWVDENRKDDIAYAEALREEQRQTEKAETVRVEYMNRMSQQEQDFAARRQALTDEIADLKRRQEVWMNEVTTQHENELTALREKNAELEARCNDLLDRYATIDETKRQEYESRLAAKDAEIETERERYDNLQNHNKTLSYLWVAVAIVGLVAAACIGLIVGMNQRLDMQVDSIVNGGGDVILWWIESVMGQLL